MLHRSVTCKVANYIRFNSWIIGIILLACLITIGQTPTPQTKEEKLAAANKLADEASALFDQGTLESYKKAIIKFQAAVKLFALIGEKQEQATSLLAIGLISGNLGDKPAALKNYESALSIYRAIKAPLGESIALINIGQVYSELGEKPKALDYFNLALPLLKQVNDKKVEAATLNNIGAIYADLGDNQKALDYYNQSLPLRRAAGDKEGEANSLTNIGAVYEALGEEQLALDYYNQSLPLSREVGDKSQEASTLSSIGGIYDALGNKPKALDYFNQSLRLRRVVGDKAGEAATLNHFGKVYFVLGELLKAIDYFTQALPLSQAVGDKEGAASILNHLGAAAEALGEKQLALNYYNEALSIRRVIGDKAGEADTLSSLSLYWSKRKQANLAIFYGKQSVNVYQQLRSNIVGLDKEVQKTYLKSIEYNYRTLADILIANGRLAEAQQVLNLLKDQQFFDFNRNQNEPIKQVVQSSREAENSIRYQQVSDNIGIIGQQIEDLKKQIGTRQPTAEQTANLQKLEASLQAATADFNNFLKQVETKFSKPLDEKDKVENVPDTVLMQTALRSLNQQTGQKAVAVYTLVGEDNFRALIVSSDGIKAVSFPIKGDDLNEKAKQLWGLLQSDRYDTTVLSKQIYDVVFKPLENEVPKDTSTIMWSLDGNLRYIPMAALWDGKQFLAERFNHVNFTRADAERMLRNLNPNWTGTGLGTTQPQTVDLFNDGDKLNFSALPGVTEELREVFKQPNSPIGILTGEVLPDDKFTKTSFLESMKQRRPVVHIASHFSFRPGDEARSFLLMGDGSAFTLAEMKKEINLFQEVDLLTLSACNTAAQQDGNGKEIDGFAELAQRLGAGSVMATLWSVSDASTPWLMRDFYANKLSTNGMTKVEALRKAQLGLLNGTAETKPLPNNEKGDDSTRVKIIITPDGKRDGTEQTRAEVVYVAEKDAPLYKKDEKKPFAHPYYWSPFVLIGNWK